MCAKMRPNLQINADTIIIGYYLQHRILDIRFFKIIFSNEARISHLTNILRYEEVIRHHYVLFKIVI